MAEPVLLIVGGLALYNYLKGSASVSVPPQQLAEHPATATAGSQPISGDASGTGPDAPLATLGSNVAAEIGAPLTVVNTDPAPVGAIIAEVDATAPPDLVAALDNDTALAMRAYAALNPDDFAAWLDRYADRIVLRNDYYLEALTGPPPERGFELTPAMLAGLGNASYKVIQALNGVYVGKSVDIFGLGASVAGQIPGVDPNLLSGLQAAAMSYRAITGITDVMTVVNAFPNVSFFELGGMAAGGVTAYPGLAALPMAGVLMAVGLVVDIGFTIIGNKPDLQKAVDVALDVASLAVLFIPVIGIVIAIVIQLVKFIIDLFGEELFGGGMTKEQKEMIEAAKYGEKLNPMYGELAGAYTPRELWRTIVQWGSGYCGGVHVVAMSVNLALKAGDVVLVGGQPYTVPADTFLGFGDNEQPGGCYWLATTPFRNITNDEQAWALGAYASVNGIVAGAQVGVRESMQVQFEDPTQKLIAARAAPMREFLIKHRLSLDQIDQIALEYRAQPHLTALATAFGWPTWQEHFAWIVEEEWERFNDTITNATLRDFAGVNGYGSMYAFRAAALAPFESLWSRASAALAAARARRAMWESYEAQGITFIGDQAIYPSWSGSAP
jgi:hypothetical protein